jgi:energy-coupling factor transporter ATP-binding protein EcfA2
MSSSPARRKQPLTSSFSGPSELASPHSTLFRPQFVAGRYKAPSGETCILSLGPARKDRRALGDRIELTYPSDTAAPPEIIDQFALTFTGERRESWRGANDAARIRLADHTIIERPVKPSIKIDNLPIDARRRAHEACGFDPATNIPGLQKALDTKTKFSPVKKKQIIAAFEAEAEARKNDTAPIKKLIGEFVAAGETRGNARALANAFDDKLSPYQFLFGKAQSFLKADQFAKIHDEATRAQDRPMAIIVAELLKTPNIINGLREIEGGAWDGFGLRGETFRTAVEGLKEQGIIREIDGFVGLAWLINAEEEIAKAVTTNQTFELPDSKLALINYALDNAAKILRRPGFVLTPEQRTAILNAFRSKISIITGPPGVGKTAVLSLINLIASMLYAEKEFPAWVIALAGRAASNAREAGTTWAPPDSKKMVLVHATTIHRALGLKAEEDDGTPGAFKDQARNINCGVLAIDEMSMLSSPLLAAVLRGSNFVHLVFVGDQDQLPPIGPGKPFRDMLQAGILPTAKLTKNWRTDCQGIRDLCAAMPAYESGDLVECFPDFEEAGGVKFVPAAWNERAAIAAGIVARLVNSGVDIEDIAIISPHKDGDAGCNEANRCVREALGFDDGQIEEGELLIVTKNTYDASVTGNAEQKETVYNGERCAVANPGHDYLDLEFPENSEGLTRCITLLMRNPDGEGADSQLPENVAFGYALSTHKAQGSQFDYVILMAERGSGRFGVVQGSNVYTAVSRARKKVFIVGKLGDFAHAATTDEIPRKTLLLSLLEPRRSGVLASGGVAAGQGTAAGASSPEVIF